jgi:membrane fusion protein (multidrug efflux system)
VEAGEWAGDLWVIYAGLKPGERVITDGVMKLGPGAPVKIAEQKPPADGKVAERPAEKQTAKK